jgi:hypothetical protein
MMAIHALCLGICFRSLDHARHLASGEDIPSIDLLRGLASLRIPGAQAEARVHLNSYAEFCERSSKALQERLNNWELKDLPRLE